MKKFMNDVGAMLHESLSGLAHCHSDILTLDSEFRFIRRAQKKTGKVALISGGGAGHEPLHAGFVGYGMLDAACPGQIFTSPTPDMMMAAAEEVDSGAGVLFIIKNYAGDVMNFTLAAEMCPNALTMLTDDDVAVERSDHSMGRRGVAGTMIVEKMVGAAAERGDSLTALKELGERVNNVTKTMGVALSSCIVPAAGGPTFTLKEDEMEMGVGIHGESGRRRVSPVMSADAIAEEIVQAIVTDYGGDVAGREALLVINGFGGTPSLELYLMYDAARRQCDKHGIKITRGLAGNYVTSLEMAGCSITLTLLDAETTMLWDAPAHTAAFRQGM
ncbi:MAG: dihydroxyacetone kinase subunit DhaK [Burkholderiaceae bacterium]|nr:MAG: dihydroxyacetone kinase subunit DhaK [Burkholderiaceae bacterium]